MSTFEEAQKWVSQQIWERWGPEPLDIYCKREYKNSVFVLFSNKQDRDKVVLLLKKDGVRIKEDFPPTIRAPKNILLGLRWKYWNGISKTLRSTGILRNSTSE